MDSVNSTANKKIERNELAPGKLTPLSTNLDEVLYENERSSHILQFPVQAHSASR